MQIALYVSNKEIIYFDSFGVEYIPKEVKRFIKETIGHKNLKTNIFSIQADKSIMCEYFCIKFTDFVLANKVLIDCTSLFSLYDLKKI